MTALKAALPTIENRDPGTILAIVIRRLLRWMKRASIVSMQRRDLANLSDDMLRDIGVSRADVDAEAARPFWDLPGGMLR